MKDKLAALYALQQLDSALAALKRQFDTLDPGRAEKKRYDTAKSAHLAADEALSTLSSTIRDTELEQQTVVKKKADYEKKLYSGTVTNFKELGAMDEEVKMLERMRAALEEKLLTMMDERKILSQQETETRKERSLASHALKQAQETYRQQAETMQAQAKVLIEQRGEAAKVIPADLLKTYESMRSSKGGVAIAKMVDGNACGGCNMALPSMLISKAREGNSIETCQNCRRILYAEK